MKRVWLPMHTKASANQQLLISVSAGTYYLWLNTTNLPTQAAAAGTSPIEVTVQDLQGISWQEITITGQSNHAGTTPMRMRRDAGYCAAAIAVFVRELAERYGGGQVSTVGAIGLHPNLINVIPSRATLTVDIPYE